RGGVEPYRDRGGLARGQVHRAGVRGEPRYVAALVVSGQQLTGAYGRGDAVVPADLVHAARPTAPVERGVRVGQGGTGGGERGVLGRLVGQRRVVGGNSADHLQPAAGTGGGHSPVVVRHVRAPGPGVGCRMVGIGRGEAERGVREDAAGADQLTG